MFLLHMLGGQTNEFPSGLNQEPCMEAVTLPKRKAYLIQYLDASREFS